MFSHASLETERIALAMLDFPDRGAPLRITIRPSFTM
jgi:hypothetical protein